MSYLIEWVRPVLPDTTPPGAMSVVKLADKVWIKDLPGGGAEVTFIDVTGGGAETITGQVGGTPGSYHGTFSYPGSRVYIFTASAAKGFISGMIFRYGPSQDSGGHWGGR